MGEFARASDHPVRSQGARPGSREPPLSLTAAVLALQRTAGNAATREWALRVRRRVLARDDTKPITPPNLDALLRDAVNKQDWAAATAVLQRYPSDAERKAALGQQPGLAGMQMIEFIRTPAGSHFASLEPVVLSVLRPWMDSELPRALSAGDYPAATLMLHYYPASVVLAKLRDLQKDPVALETIGMWAAVVFEADDAVNRSFSFLDVESLTIAKGNEELIEDETQVGEPVAVGGGSVKSFRDVSLQKFGASRLREVDPGYFSFEYSGPDAPRTGWLQFMSLEAEMLDKNHHHIDWVTDVETQYEGKKETLRWGTDTHPIWYLDTSGSKAPFYGAELTEDRAGRSAGTSSTYISNERTATLLDRPTVDKNVVKRAFENDDVAELIIRMKFHDYLVRGMDVLYENTMTVEFPVTRGQADPNAGRSMTPGTGTASSGLAPEHHKALVDMFPNWGFYASRSGSGVRPAPGAAGRPVERGGGRLDRATRAPYGRYLARAPLTLKDKVEHARHTDPSGYVLDAVRGMAPDRWTFEERAAEITWRIIWMFLPEHSSDTLVSADTGIRGAELAPTRTGGLTEIVIGPDFIANLTADNLDLRRTMLQIVVLGKDAAKDKLKQDFGFAEVLDGSAQWTVGELAETYAGLARIKTPDRAGLVGVTLRRVDTITEHGEHFAGDFTFSAVNVSAGQTTPPDMDQVLRLANTAFSDPDRAAEVVVHEAGHAIENDKQRRTGLAAGVAIAAHNLAVESYTTAANDAGHAVNAAIIRANSYLPADKASANTFIAAVTAASLAINAFGVGGPTGAAPREKAAADAVKARNTARGALPGNNPADTDFARACELQDDWLTAARAMITAAATRNTAKAAATASRGKLPGDANMSLRLERFVAVVNNHSITPITPYAAKNWPAHPEEFFAEAYSMWVNDPKRLEGLARPLKEFFDAGEQRK